MHFGEAATSDERMSRTLHEGKADSIEKQSSVDTCKSVRSEQVRGTEALPKAPLSRSNQRSFGFLPLICKDNADEAVATKPSKGLHQETDIIVSESTSDYPVSSRDDKEEAQGSTSVPLAIPASSKCDKGICSTVQVSSELSDSEGSKEQEKEGEPTHISEYFFGDIFMEVDDSE
ncbi:hypothetical protein JRQ81_013772 [Phrynocephalus forsythii]|uniref:Uncharacterized protein n=1 Tax=Phrynocephalus forsythii TaxID=171643 RepID=A0A9Q0Y1S8_9SAUR|nr:hypothetical protein JRQ81_013772 [Phrynocephalus forsythii]